MKIALCLSGELRSIDHTIDKLINLLNNPKWEMDVYYSGWEDDENLFKIENLSKIGAQKSICLEPRITVDTSEYFPNKEKENIHLSIIRQLHCISIANKICSFSNISYDFIIRCRPDVLFLNDKVLDFSILKKDRLYVLDHDHWHGLNDRFYLGSPSVMNIIDNRLSQLRYYNEVGGVSQYEAFLLFVTEIHGIEIERLIGFETCLLRTNGDKEGELIHVRNGTIVKTSAGIWHNKLSSYI